MREQICLATRRNTFRLRNDGRETRAIRLYERVACYVTVCNNAGTNHVILVSLSNYFITSGAKSSRLPSFRPSFVSRVHAFERTLPECSSEGSFIVERRQQTDRKPRNRVETLRTSMQIVAKLTLDTLQLKN